MHLMCASYVQSAEFAACRITIVVCKVRKVQCIEPSVQCVQCAKCIVCGGGGRHSLQSVPHSAECT